MNRSIFNFIFALSKNPHVANIALFFSYHLVAAVAVILVYWSLFLAPRKIYAFSLFFLSSLGVTVIVNILKILFLAERPYVKIKEIVPLVEAWGTSFPSWHAAFMANLAVAGYSLDRELGLVLIILAVLTGISRIVIGVHYLSDVLAGWVIGGLIGFASVVILNKI